MPVALLLGSALLLSLGACSGPEGGPNSAARSTPGSGSPDGSPAGAAAPAPSEPLAAWQADLLDLAFQAVSAFPTVPHVKNRCREQEAIVGACLELDRPERAARYAESIDNWRRGLACADLAYYHAQRGDSAEVRLYLGLAGRIADESSDPGGAQNWRRDRIRVKIARTYLLLGKERQAAQYEEGAVDSELGAMADVKAMQIDSDAFDEQMKILDRILETDGFEQVQSALESCAQLYNRFYADGDRRSRLAETVRKSSSRLPIMVRVDLLMTMAGFALDHQDSGEALALLGESQRVVDGARWLPQDQVSLVARLAMLRFRAGEKEAARKQLDGAVTLYDQKRDEIVNIYRAGALRAVAEAYRSLGDAATALAVYRRAVQEGVDNPNSRPRAVDLAATCCSMAVHGVEPDAALWKDLRRIRDALGDPW